MRSYAVRLLICVFLLAALRTAAAAEPRTGFQSSNVWKPEINLPADVVFVYSADAERIKTWADYGFETWVMLGASWLSKETDVVVQHPEIRQAVKDGTPFEMIPGRAWGGARGPVDRVVQGARGSGHGRGRARHPARGTRVLREHGLQRFLQAGLAGILPRTLARAPRIRGKQLARRTAQGPPVRGVLPPGVRAREIKGPGRCSAWCPCTATSITRTGISWPLHHAFLALDHTDGFIAQVWTGTAKHAHMLGGEPFADTFFYAYLEYSYFAELVRGTGKQAWFLTDPVEDAEGRVLGRPALLVRRHPGGCAPAPAGQPLRNRTVAHTHLHDNRPVRGQPHPGLVRLGTVHRVGSPASDPRNRALGGARDMGRRVPHRGHGHVAERPWHEPFQRARGAHAGRGARGHPVAGPASREIRGTGLAPPKMSKLSSRASTPGNPCHRKSCGAWRAGSKMAAPCCSLAGADAYDPHALVLVAREQGHGHAGPGTARPTRAPSPALQILDAHNIRGRVRNLRVPGQPAPNPEPVGPGARGPARPGRSPGHTAPSPLAPRRTPACSMPSRANPWSGKRLPGRDA